MRDNRHLLLGLLLIGMIGTNLELLLLGHTEEFAQWAPLALLALGTVAALLCVRPRPAAIRTLRVVMIGFLITGVAGLVLHYRGNAEFELERVPTLGGLELVWEAVRGATPALAPGAMILIGLMGLLFCYRHPGLTEDPAPTDRRPQDEPA